jgi:deoxyribonuclease V
MIACLDADYRGDAARAACVLLARWEDPEPVQEHVACLTGVAPYEPGRFFRRELPCLLAVLGALGTPPDVVVVDGYVWLDGSGTPGLGGHLHAALGGRTAVVGVAKTRYAGAPAAEVLRGRSRRPLYLTAAGIEPAAAAAHVRSMHGPFRIPAALKRVDQLARRW